MLDLAVEALGKPTEGDTAATIGWVLVLSSLVGSGKLQTASQNEKDFIYRAILDIGMKKHFVEIAICELVADSVKNERINSKELAKCVLPLLFHETPKDGRQTLYSVFFYVLLRKHTPVQQKIDFLLPSNFESLSMLVKSSTEHLPAIHPALKQLVASAVSSADFGDFWTQVIEAPLYAANIPEKITLAFHLLQFALPLINAEQVKVVISPTFMKPFLQSLRNKHHTLHKQAMDVSSAIAKSINTKTEAGYQLAVAECITSAPVGTLLFDEVTQSKMLSNIITSFDKASLKKWLKKLRRTFYKWNEIDEKDLLRASCIRQIGHCLKNPKFDELEMQVETLQFLLLNAYFNLEQANDKIDFCDKTVAAEITENLRTTIQQVFWKSVDMVCKSNQKTAKERRKRESEILQKLKKYSNSLVDFKVTTVASNVTEHYANVPVTEEFAAGDDETITGFAIFDGVLHLAMLIEPENASQALQELKECLRRVGKKRKDDHPFWADVLTDLAISVLSRVPPEAAGLITSAFGCFSKHVTKESSNLLHDVLLTNGLEVEDENSDDDENSDNENSGDDNDSDDQSDDEEEEELDDKVNEDELKFRNDLLTALGPAAATGDDDDEQPLPDEDEMMAVDEALSEVFRQKFNRAKQEKQNKAALVSLKLRCCDLATVLLAGEVSVEFVLKLLPAVIALARNACRAKSDDIALGHKAVKLLNQITKLKGLKKESDNQESMTPREVLDICFTNINKLPKQGK